MILRTIIFLKILSSQTHNNYVHLYFQKCCSHKIINNGRSQKLQRVGLRDENRERLAKYKAIVKQDIKFCLSICVSSKTYQSCIFYQFFMYLFISIKICHFFFSRNHRINCKIRNIHGFSLRNTNFFDCVFGLLVQRVQYLF